MSEENKADESNESNILSDSHGEPTGFMYLAMIVALLAFGLIWSASEKGWVKTILDIFE